MFQTTNQIQLWRFTWIYSILIRGFIYLSDPQQIPKYAESGAPTVIRPLKRGGFFLPVALRFVAKSCGPPSACTKS